MQILAYDMKWDALSGEGQEAVFWVYLTYMGLMGLLVIAVIVSLYLSERK